MFTDKVMFDGKFGLEKENLRVTRDGKLALSAHPDIWSKGNPYITTDFSESQIEMITPPLPSIKQAFDFLWNINQIVSEQIGDELLWNQSNPPILPTDETRIPIAVFDDDQQSHYRLYLADKYGRKKSVISGVHFNFSFSEAYLAMLQKQQESPISSDHFHNVLYMKVAKYMLQYRWLFVYLFGASPVFHDSFVEKCVKKSELDGKGSCHVSGMQSLRNSMCGYRNNELLPLDYQSFAAYQASIVSYIEKGDISQASELYTAVRLKGDAERIAYLELRFLDLNPLFPIGVNEKDLELLHMFFIYFSQQPDFVFDELQQQWAERNQLAVAQAGKEAAIYNEHGEKSSIDELALPLLQNMLAFFKQVKVPVYEFEKRIVDARTKIEDEQHTYGAIIQNDIANSDYVTFHLEKMQQFAKEVRNVSFTLRGEEDLELSTQIVMRAAYKHGLLVEVLDRAENFIRLVDGQSGHVEYVKEATKTSLDAYSQVLVMENKAITKQVLTEHGIQVPQGYIVHDVDEALALLESNKLPDHLVIKPNNTNFGKGITIFTEGYDAKQYIEAITFALQEDWTVLVEPFISGKEYRFLVVEGEVVAVLHRRSANVVGDGEMTIERLVAEKNKDALRSVGYKTPLENIQLGRIEQDFLSEQGFKINSIPQAGERVYLRENSNISTGGDSVDMTDVIDESYKQVAVDAAAAVGVAICGVDMLIEDIYVPKQQDTYAILELNFNPAIHIHCYPYEGINRQVGDIIIHALFPQIPPKR